MSRVHVGYQCGICSKLYERRDLRDRHKRRCAQTFAKPKRSKQRSCVACAGSKLSCDQGQPSCSRCSNRGIICEYVGDAADSFADGHRDATSEAVTVSVPQAEDCDHGGLPEMVGNEYLNMTAAFSSSHSQALAIAETQHTTPNWNLDIEQAGGSSGSHPSVENMAIQMVSTNGDEWSGALLENENMSFAALWSSGLQQNNPSIDRLDSTPQSDLDARQPDQRTQWSPSSTNRAPAISAEDMVSLVMSYLPMMTSQLPPTPPFIHDQIYHCNKGDVKEPIARAMICIQAYSNAMPSGRSFVHDMINKERDSLIESFNSCKSDIDMLATLHATIVFQVLGFCSDAKEQVRSAELHHTFLLKMTRKFAQRHRQDLVDDSANSLPFDWTHWAFIETLRRTIFLVQVINVMTTRLQKQHPFFYEALDDDLILNMPLPAAAPLWEANQEQQWLFIRSKQPRKHLTGRMVQQDYTSIPNDADTFTILVIGSLILDDRSAIPARC